MQHTALATISVTTTVNLSRSLLVIIRKWVTKCVYLYILCVLKPTLFLCVCFIWKIYILCLFKLYMNLLLISKLLFLRAKDQRTDLDGRWLPCICCWWTNFAVLKPHTYFMWLVSKDADLICKGKFAFNQSRWVLSPTKHRKFRLNTFLFEWLYANSKHIFWGNFLHENIMFSCCLAYFCTWKVKQRSS